MENPKQVEMYASKCRRTVRTVQEVPILSKWSKILKYSMRYEITVVVVHGQPIVILLPN
jgi:hypothetical protein